MAIDPGILDDPTALASRDPGGMLGLVARTGDQLRRGFELGCGTAGLPSADGVRAIVICGMGGSGIVGDVLRSLYAARSSVPLEVVKGYVLPDAYRRDALVVAVSFSGNTEETLSAYSQAVAAGCRVVAVSVGGALAALAETDAVPHVAIPGDVSMPRVGLGYQTGAVVGVLAAMGLLPPVGDDLDRTVVRLEALAAEAAPERPTAGNLAKQLAVWLADRVPLVWSTQGLAEAAGLRWKTQFNENAKAPAFHATLPELDHNDIEGWSTGAGRPFGLVVLRHRHEHPRLDERIRVTYDVIAGAGLEHREVRVDGLSRLETLFALILWGDFTATYLGLLRGFDPSPIPALTNLKERLR